jgi:hypothetical protein
MKTIGVAAVAAILFIETVNAQQSATSGLVTNLVQTLPFIEKFAKTLDLDIPLPLTTNRVSRFYPCKFSAPGQYGAAVWIDSDRWVFGFNVKGHFIGNFSDRRYSLGSVTSKPLSPAEVNAMTVPSSITEAQALKMACEYLPRLGYNVNRLPVRPPTVRQEKPFPVFTVEWLWTAVPEMTNAPYIKMEIDGLRGKVTSFFTLRGALADTPTMFPAEDPK